MKSSIDLAGELRSYQREGVHFLASRDAALLADEMGLAKLFKPRLPLR
jgi:SNF2 family DNA or RNA helicase